MMALILQFGPWLLGILGAVAALFMRQQVKTAKAEAKQEVAEAHAKIDQGNTAAAQSGAAAVKERINVENDIAARPAGDSAQRLRDTWSRD